MVKISLNTDLLLNLRQEYADLSVRVSVNLNNYGNN